MNWWIDKGCTIFICITITLWLLAIASAIIASAHYHLISSDKLPLVLIAINNIVCCIALIVVIINLQAK